jgi:hypothetical protein
MRCTSVVIADRHPVVLLVLQGLMKVSAQRVASKLLHPAVTVRAASKRFHTGDNSAGNGGDGYFAGTLNRQELRCIRAAQHGAGGRPRDSQRSSDEHRDF